MKAVTLPFTYPPIAGFAVNTASMAKSAVTLGGLLQKNADAAKVPTAANPKPTTSFESTARPLTMVEAAGRAQGGVAEMVKKALPLIAIAGGVALVAVAVTRNKKKRKS